VNRSLAALAALGTLFLAAPAGAQVALVVGSVRDQRGASIAGAVVSSSPPGKTAITAADGTFAIEGEGIASVTIRCRYCASRTFAVKTGEPVVAIVQRFAALLDQAPSQEDLAALPYGRVESAVSLRPFELLRQSSTFYPGSALSDRGLQPENGLLIDAGVPDYDVVFGASPYTAIPAHYENSAGVTPASNAFLYGDQAGSGIVTLDPFAGGASGVALYGSDAMLRVEDASQNADVVAGTSSSWQESRQRADGRLTIPLSQTQTVAFNAGTEQGYQYVPAGYQAATNFSFAHALFDDAQPTVDLQASAVYDRGDYTMHVDDFPIGDIWSDAQFTASARTHGTVQFFADASNRLSTGLYDAQTFRIAGTLQQNRFDAGLTTGNANFDVTAGAGVFGFTYTGGSNGYSMPSSGHLVTPSLQLDLLPIANWSARVDASNSFYLPNLWQQYAYEFYPTTAYDRAALYSGTLTYTDQSRISASYEAAWQFVHGYTNGQVTSSGLALTWQIAPALSLRTWAMLASDGTVSSGQLPTYENGIQPSVGDVWLTYQNGNALRVDAIYRKDVLDGGPFYHFDGDVSGPIGGAIRWYAGVENRIGTTHVDAGLQIGR
jgi:hypothetical protein